MTPKSSTHSCALLGLPGCAIKMWKYDSNYIRDNTFQSTPPPPKKKNEIIKKSFGNSLFRNIAP